MEFAFEKSRFDLEQKGSILVARTRFPESVRMKFIEIFGEKGLKLEDDEDNGESRFIIEDLNLENRSDLEIDLRFLSYHPNLPTENIVSRLNNYIPQNDSQTEALSLAIKLIGYKGSRAAGLYLYGVAGVGKTHIAVAIAKELFQRGYHPHFLNEFNSLDYEKELVFPDKLDIDAQDFWILDDLNTHTLSPGRVYRKLVPLLHDRGGRIIVTANIPYEGYQKQILKDDPANAARFADRTRALFKVLNLTGESYRPDSAWFN